MADSNVNVVGAAFKLAGVFAKKGGKEFNAKSLVAGVVEKFKDKNKNVSEEALKALELFLNSISTEEMIEEVKESLGQKNEKAKINSISFIDIVLEHPSVIYLK